MRKQNHQKIEIDRVLLRQILVLSLPIIMENVLQTLLGTVDTYFAGQLNDDSIAAIGVTNLVLNLFIAFYTALSVGVTAVIARYTGEKNREKANNAAGQAVLLSFLIGGIAGGAAFLFRHQILGISGASGIVLETALPYFQIVAVPSVLICLTMVLSACLRSCGDTKTPMRITGAANILNIILNAVFMYMGMGVTGLALATTISRLFTVVFLLFRLTRKNSGIRISMGRWRLEKAVCKTILGIGIPAGIEKLLMRIGQLIYNGVIISIGTSAYVAHQIGGTIESYSYIPAFGFSMAAATLVGISLGEKDVAKARKSVLYTYLLSCMIMVPMGIVYFFGAPFFTAQFTDTASVQKITVDVLRIVAFFQPMIAMSQVYAGALQGAGDTKYPMYTTFLGTWLIHIGLGYLLGVVMGMGLTGIWLGYVLSNTLKGILLLIRLRQGKWATIQLQ